nr:immunoglobulin light chain junction region [Macaca mulatta]MPN95470.1 immunoglobulin light chain junction region [Macaca mulatta]MPN95700.1 immunoglobulin light chain junction region [Macaca mulatta]MPN96132.1 immunoglobulin light chain junction region [Macaca mulatta]MPN96287.1 immunoglobulin light chain junction region [Macaca mulatta]
CQQHSNGPQLTF